MKIFDPALMRLDFCYPMYDLEVIVPVKNEAKNIGELVRRIDKSLSVAKVNYRITFVDDRSTDSTTYEINVASEKYPIKLLIKKGKPGKAYSILEGAHEADAPIIAMIDGDLQYPPEALAEMYELTKNHGVVVANRKNHKGSLVRRLGSRLNYLIFEKILHGLNCDTQSGLKVFKKEIIEHLSQADVTRWTLDLPLLHTAQELGYSIGCLDIDFSERKNGKSKVNFLATAFEIGLGALKLKFKRKRIYEIKPERQGSAIGAGIAYKRKRFITHTQLPHHESALRTFNLWQKAFLLLTFGLIATGFILNIKLTAVILVAIVSLIYFIDFIFSIYVILKSLHFPPEIKFSDKELAQVKDSELPVYTVLCPLYREAKVLPSFIESIDALEWPKSKLEVQLLLEEDDKETQKAAEDLNLSGHFQVVIVPNSLPKTKAKASNYGLQHAKGEYVVIYDAEDRPDPLQLKKAYLAFKIQSDKLFCLQSKLNYYNPAHNLLTRLFTAEYSLWFDVVLPGLQSIESTIPLGGTSNHFRTEDLKKIHGWDPFNVTEDCDLGVRLFKAGYKTAIIDSTTYEEANSNLKNWIRQRSRWIKGYLQTYLVHNRRPLHFLLKHRIQALIFQLVIGMRITFMLINPLLWLATILYFAAYQIFGPAIEAVYPAPVFYIAVVCLVFGNFMYLFNYMIGCAKRGSWSLIKFVFLIPIYWIFASIAAVTACYQLIVKPHYWEKTLHGLHLAKEEKRKLELQRRLAQESERRAQIERIKSWAGNGAFGVASLIFASILANLSNFIYNAYLGRSLSLVEFGTVGFFSSIYAISAVVFGALGRSVTYKTAYILGKLNRPSKDFWANNFKWISLISVLITSSWVILLPFLFTFFKVESLLPLLLFTPIWSLGMLASVNTGALAGNLKFFQIGFLALVETLVKLSATVIFVDKGLTNFVYAAIPLSILSTFALSFIFVQRIKGDQGAKVKVAFPKAFFATSILAGASSVTFLSLDVVLAKHFLAPTEAGLYALLSLSGKMIYFFGTLFSQFITAYVAKSEGANKDSSLVFYKILAATGATTIFAWIVVGLLGELTIPFLLGEKAKGITHLTPMYGMALAQLAISTSIIAYNQVKKRYLFPIVGFGFAIWEVFAIFSRHSSVSEIAVVVSYLSIAQLFTIGLLHLGYGVLETFARNLLDFSKVFSPVSANGQGLTQNKLKILIFNWRDTRHAYAGGAENYVHEIAKRWVKDGHEVSVFCGNDRKNKINEVVDGVRVVRRGGFYTVYLWGFVYYMIQFRGKFDIVIDCENGVPFFTPLYVRVPKILLIHHVHQDVFRQHLSFPLSLIALFAESKLMPFLYRNTSIVTTSGSSKKDILGLGWTNGEAIEVVNPGVNRIFTPKTKKTRSPSFIYLGRLKHYKNIDSAILAFAKVVEKHRNARLLIAGKGEEEDYLRGLVKNLRLEESVKFLGFVTEKEKYKLLASSWAAIQPSSFEGWGITVIEANSVGTPVLASKINGLTDSVVDGKTGLLVPVRSEKVLFKAMEGIIADSKLRVNLSEKAYEWAKLFSWDKSAREFMRVVFKTIESDKEIVFVKRNVLVGSVRI